MFNGIEPQPIVRVIAPKGSVCINRQTILINQGVHP